MSDKFPFFAAESGTWKTTSPDPHIDLSGTALTLGTYPAQTFKAAADDATLDFASTNTCTIVVWKDATNWKRYEGAVWTDAATDTLDMSAATLMGAAGTISDDDSVSVVASLPAITPTAIGASAAGGVREFFVDAAAMVPRVTAGAYPFTQEYTTNDVSVDYYLFDSGATEEGVQFKLVMPDAWDLGTIKAKFFWDAATGATADDGVTWGISARAVSNDDAIDAAFAASVDTDDVVIAVGDLHVSPASAAVTVSGTPALGDLILFEITRVTGDAQDNMAEDAKLFGVQIQYTESTTAPSAW